MKILIAVAVLVAVVAGVALYTMNRKPAIAGQADPADSAQVARGEALYADRCALCHGAQLEGQPDWQSRNADDRLPAPPHDESGHSWHHPDMVLFELTKYGPQKFAGSDYQSDMPAFEGEMSDQQIWDSIAYIMSRWLDEIATRQQTIDDRYRAAEGAEQ
ncbi:MAG: cytochrome c [Alphaproteobacteria bacterium]|nr:cytochrome c [Alphaproteobacteria bacterium]